MINAPIFIFIDFSFISHCFPRNFKIFSDSLLSINLQLEFFTVSLPNFNVIQTLTYIEKEDRREMIMFFTMRGPLLHHEKKKICWFLSTLNVFFLFNDYLFFVLFVAISRFMASPHNYSSSSSFSRRVFCANCQKGFSSKPKAFQNLQDFFCLFSIFTLNEEKKVS